MSLEQKIADLTVEVRHLVEIMQRLRVPSQDTKSEPEPKPKATPKAKPKSAPEPKSAPAAEEKRELTKAELNDLCLTLSREGMAMAVHNYLERFGAKKISDLSAEDFVAFQDLIIEEVERLG